VSQEELRCWHDAPPEERNAIRGRLIEKFGPLVKLVATRIIRKLPPQIELGDLINTGVLGLIDAIDKYDPDRDIRFETYAEFRIRGAILDELRTLDWVPRSIRQRLNKLEKAYEELEATLGRSATDEEVAEKMGISNDDLFGLLNHANGVSLISLDDLGMRGNAVGYRGNYQDYIRDPNTEDIVEMLNLHEIKDLVADTITKIPENERNVLSMYYYDELTMKEIGVVLEITESRVSQIHNKAVLSLRGKLKRHLANSNS
jgi:RNA polymerase sigma factor FliA